jgi:hypothetical protein
MLVAAGALYVQFGKMKQAQDERDRAMQETQSAMVAKEAADSQPKEARYAAADRLPGEEALFLNDLRMKAMADGVQIVSWTAKGTDYKGGAAPAPGTAGATNDDPALKGLTKISSDLKLIGPYGPMRKFVDDMTRSDRLFTLSNATWSRGEAGSGMTTLTVTLGRYVAPAAENTAASAVASTTGATATNQQR